MIKGNDLENMSYTVIEIEDKCEINDNKIINDWKVAAESIRLSCDGDELHNFGMTKSNDELDDYEEYLDYINEDDKTNDSINNSGSKICYKTSYYCGLLFLTEVDKDNKVKQVMDKDGKEILIYSKCRFSKLLISNMLEMVKTDLSDRNNGGKKQIHELDVFERLYHFEETETIDLSEIDESDLSDTIKKEYSSIKELNTIKNTSERVELPDDNIIHPYVIDMALLFELYARAYIKQQLYSGYTMLTYYNKPNEYFDDELDSEKVGAKNICLKEDQDSELYLDGIAIPDIVLYDEENDKYIILDAKYKDPSGRQDRDDRLQLLAYAFLYDAEEIGHIFPYNEKLKKEDNNNGKNYYKYEYDVNVDRKELKYTMLFIGTEETGNSENTDN